MSQTDFNGIESYVWEMSKPKSNTTTDWFPKEDALCIQKMKENMNQDDGLDLNELIDDADGNNERLCTKLDNILLQHK